MRVTNYELFRVLPRWLFLRIETEEGLVGWGEPILEGRARTIEEAVRELMDKYILGRKLKSIEDTWQLLYRGGFYRGGPVLMSAVAGIDQALWDIKGKYLGLPVYELLGGPVRERVRVYRWVGGDEPAQIVEEARAHVAKGFNALKLNVAGKLHYIETRKVVENIVQQFAAVREAVGSDVDLAIDFHGRVSPALAPRLFRALEPFFPFFIEEPILPFSPKKLSLLKQVTSIPIALGERFYSRWDFQPYFECGSIDIAQPDLSHAGGITECKKIAALAEVYGVAMAFHCPLGPIALAACLQVAAAVPNFLIQETSFGIHYNEGVELTDYVKNPEVFALKNGCIELPTGPGLGIEVDEGAVREAAVKGHDWMNPVWRLEDGSLAEW